MCVWCRVFFRERVNAFLYVRHTSWAMRRLRLVGNSSSSARQVTCWFASGFLNAPSTWRGVRHARDRWQNVWKEMTQEAVITWVHEVGKFIPVIKMRILFPLLRKSSLGFVWMCLCSIRERPWFVKIVRGVVSLVHFFWNLGDLFIFHWNGNCVLLWKVPYRRVIFFRNE